MRSAALSSIIMCLALLITPIQTANAKQTQNVTSKCQVAENGRSAIITGAVRVRTFIVLHRRVRLLEALTLSGGLAKKAKGIVQLSHFDGNSETLRFRNIKGDDMKANPYLQGGDVGQFFERSSLVERNAGY